MNLVSDPLIGPAELHLHGDDGGSGLMARLRCEIQDRGLSDKIQLHGSYYHTDLPGILAGLDVVVLPSEWEGLPLVLVEAMQNGVPFVATSAGGTVELGENNPDVLVTGIPWGDYVEGLRQFVPKLRAGQIDGQRLHQWVEQRYGFDAVWPQWKEALLNSRHFFGLE
jgi:glycosyltransferase involved in cell wall biosynthesis